MASRSGTRYNVLAGAFLLACLVLAVITSFVLSDAKSRLVRTTDYVVRFSLQQGAIGLQPGSNVLLAGQKVGRVLAVDVAKAPLPAGPGQPDVSTPVGIDVTVTVHSDIVLYEDAAFTLERPLLGNLTTINITSVGTPASARITGKSSRLEPGERIDGALAPPGFLAQAGLGPEQIQQFRQILADTQQAISRINKLVDESAPTVQKSLDDVSAITRSAREKWPEWAGKADTVMTNVEHASGRIDGIVATAESGVGDAKETLAELRSIVEENRAKLDSIIANTDAAMAKLNGETLPAATEATQKGRDAMASLKNVTERADTLLAEQTPNVRRTLANARLATDQMKLAMAEIRAAPWRVLFRPATKEMETELLYDAVRAYATAVSDLRAAGESLESAAGSDGSPQALDRATLEELTRSIRDRFGRYQQAEQALFDRLLKQSGGRPPEEVLTPPAEEPEPPAPSR
ncbi:MAG: hypothetical protein IT436_18450 [Phycisphaerales bacterium]|nr:hypothetical protein [Phycisphaerales bacterium]